jgi:hypothetical protein
LTWIFRYINEREARMKLTLSSPMSVQRFTQKYAGQMVGRQQEWSMSSEKTSPGATRRSLLGGLGAALSLPLSASAVEPLAQSSRTYKNPLGLLIGDPYLPRVPGDGYYIYGTGGGSGTDLATAFPTFRSKNLVGWTPAGQTYKRNPADSWCIGDFWAPEVYALKGKYFMFCSAQWRDNPNKEKENFRIGVAVADAPAGPFQDLRNRPIFDPGYPIIDADVLFDADGRMYLYYSRCCYKHPVESELADWARKEGWYSEIEESWIYCVELKPDFSGVIGEPVLVLRPPAGRIAPRCRTP